jgi:hypothetical protein
MKKLFTFFAIGAIVLGMASCGGNDGNVPEPESDIVINPHSDNGMMSHEFTVGRQNKKVRFSQGNLQYNASRTLWKFATNQWESLGTENDHIGEADYKGWIDLFGWSTANNPTEASQNFSKYPLPFQEWGENKIANGGNSAHQWRTLKKDEWVYLLFNRPNASKKVGLGRVNHVKGLILIPDTWQQPITVTVFKSLSDMHMPTQGTAYYDGTQGADYFTNNTYSADEWDTMEEAGAIFLPVTGFRYNGVSLPDQTGFYWSATPDPDDDKNACYFFIHKDNINPKVSSEVFRGMGVRLVRDAE